MSQRTDGVTDETRPISGGKSTRNPWAGLGGRCRPESVIRRSGQCWVSLPGASWSSCSGLPEKRLLRGECPCVVSPLDCQVLGRTLAGCLVGASSYSHLFLHLQNEGKSCTDTVLLGWRLYELAYIHGFQWCPGRHGGSGNNSNNNNNVLTIVLRVSSC